MLARKGIVVAGPGDALFVTGYSRRDPPPLWRSTNYGATWSAVDVGSQADGAVGNSDVDLAVAPDGTLYLVAMSYDRQAGEGTGIAVGSSRDGGATWTWASLSRERYDDRPWVEVAPDGVAHVIWNDGAGVSHAVSRDGGRSWSERHRIHPLGGSSQLAIGPTGTIAVRITPLSASSNRFDEGVDHLAVSTDGGESWVLRDVPGTRTWNPTFDPSGDLFRWVEPVMWDAAGALYLLSGEDTTLWLSRSTDDGASWNRWPVVQNSQAPFYPYLVAGRLAGELAATWFTGWGESLRAYLAYIRKHAMPDSTPEVVRAAALAIPAFRMSSDRSEPIRDPAGEYFPAIFLHDGRLAVVTTNEDPAADR